MQTRIITPANPPQTFYVRVPQKTSIPIASSTKYSYLDLRTKIIPTFPSPKKPEERRRTQAKIDNRLKERRGEERRGEEKRREKKAHTWKKTNALIKKRFVYLSICLSVSLCVCVHANTLGTLYISHYPHYPHHQKIKNIKS